MRNLSNNPENVKADLARQLQEAAREADAYNGPSPVDYFRAHGDWDREDFDGVLWHDTDGVTPMPDGSHMPCPYCRLRKLKREYGLLLHIERRKSRHEYQ